MQDQSPQVPNLINILDETFRVEFKEKSEYFKGAKWHHNPSSASAIVNGKVEGACLRQLYWRAVKEPESDPQDPTSSYAAWLGDAIHWAVQKRLSKSRELSIMPETKGQVLVDGLTTEISYRLDGLLSVDNAIGGLEIKTTQGEALSNNYYGIRTKGPKLDHLLQVITYFNTFPGLKWFILFYIGRDNGFKLQFNIARNGDGYSVKSLSGVDFSNLLTGVSFSSIVDRWKTLETYILTKEVPPRDYKVWLKEDGTIQALKQIKGEKFKSDWRCNYCSFKTKCWSQPDARNAAYQKPNDGGTA
jgi:hypothetical protein